MSVFPLSRRLFLSRNVHPFVLNFGREALEMYRVVFEFRMSPSSDFSFCGFGASESDFEERGILAVGSSDVATKRCLRLTRFASTIGRS